ncbi:MAG TPA: hypothetical protein VGI14_07925 [Casimicrobiaceae bacterium]|jgi:hypothetical protein
MMPRSPDPAVLRTAIILLDRPEVGFDGHGAQERLPSRLRIRATVVGHGPVACMIDVGAVRALAGRERPTWSDLQTVWQTLATSIDRKIRTGQVSAAGQPHGWAAIDITPADVPA